MKTLKIEEADIAKLKIGGVPLADVVASSVAAEVKKHSQEAVDLKPLKLELRNLRNELTGLLGKLGERVTALERKPSKAATAEPVPAPSGSPPEEPLLVDELKAVRVRLETVERLVEKLGANPSGEEE